MSKRNLYLIAYDIGQNKRRLKIAKLLESLGARVQGSVFEVYLNSEELNIFKQQASNIINPDEDSLRLYILCKACHDAMHVIGQGNLTKPPGVIIID